MPIQVHPLTLPKAQGTLVNGKLTPCQLTPVFFPGVGYRSLGVMTARAWQAMAIVCKAETGYDLTTVGAYRSIDGQIRALQDPKRYTTTFNADTCYGVNDSGNRTYEGVKYYLLKGAAPSSRPGTSNHGNGIANDTAIYTGGKIVGITSIGKVWLWLQANAVRFGFSWETLPSRPHFEPWHIRYFMGDVPAQRVLETEAFFESLK